MSILGLPTDARQRLRPRLGSLGLVRCPCGCTNDFEVVDIDVMLGKLSADERRFLSAYFEITPGPFDGSKRNLNNICKRSDLPLQEARKALKALVDGGLINTPSEWFANPWEERPVSEYTDLIMNIDLRNALGKMLRPAARSSAAN